MVEARFGIKLGVGHTLTVTGHATGSEATCAAVSCLVQVLETALDDLIPGAYKYKKSIKKGKVTISAIDTPITYMLFRTIKHSFMRLAAADPERVRVIEEEDNDEL